MPLSPNSNIQDANFPHRFIWCRSRLEGVSRRWKPFGMPRIYPAFSRMVFFLYGRGSQHRRGRGTAGNWDSYRRVGRALGTTDTYMRSPVTTSPREALPSSGSIPTTGKSRWLEFEPHESAIHENTVTIWLPSMWTDRLHQPEDDFSFLPSSLIATPDFMRDVEFGIGEDGFMLGLFANHPGKERNLIAARFGNVSLLASDDDPIRQGNKDLTPSHLFDMRSRTGFSGSPVFLPIGRQREICGQPL